jgi:hypothetical protein
MRNRPLEFGEMKDALAHISTRMKLPLQRFVEESTLLRDQMKTRQTTLSAFRETTAPEPV